MNTRCAAGILACLITGACGRIGYEPLDDASGGGPPRHAAYIKPSNTHNGQYFGWSVALSGDGRTLAVGAVGDTGSAGAVFVFVRDASGWREQAILRAANSDPSDELGWSLAISADGSVIAASAPRDDSAATGIDGDDTDNSLFGAGAVHVFARTGNTWTREAYIKASNTGEVDNFGESLALSGDGSTLAVGAPFELSSATGIDADQTNNDLYAAGAVYVFTRTGTTWNQQAYIKPSTLDEGDSFGTALALSGDGSTLLASSPYESGASPGLDGDQSDNSADAAGAVFMFARTGTTWAQSHYVKASNPDGATPVGDQFGACVSFADGGAKFAVGAGGERSASPGIDGDQTNNELSYAGAVYVFARTGLGWTQEAYVKASNPGEGDYLCNSALSRDGDVLAAGANSEKSAATGIDGDQLDDSAIGAGAVYLFGRRTGRWAQDAYIKAINTDAGHRFGTALAVSHDAATIAISASRENRGGTGTDADPLDSTVQSVAGAVYVLER